MEWRRWRRGGGGVGVGVEWSEGRGVWNGMEEEGWIEWSEGGGRGEWR